MPKKVVVDAGHGGWDNGVRYKGRREKDDNLNLALEVGRILTDNGIDVVYTRTDDVYQSPSQKAYIGNEENADLFLSIHRNDADTDNTYTGVGTLIYDNVGIKKDIAQEINQNLANLGFENIGTEIIKNLAVLRQTKMPAVLVEVGFIDNDADNAIFDSRFEDIARGIAYAIVDNLKNINVFQSGIINITDDMKNFDKQLKQKYIKLNGNNKNYNRNMFKNNFNQYGLEDNMLVNTPMGSNYQQYISDEVSTNNSYQQYIPNINNNRMYMTDEMSTNNNQYMTDDEMSTNNNQYMTDEMSTNNSNQYMTDEVSTNNNQYMTDEMSTNNSNQYMTDEMSTNNNQYMTDEMSTNNNQYMTDEMSTNNNQYMTDEMSTNNNQYMTDEMSTNNNNQYMTDEMSTNNNNQYMTNNGSSYVSNGMQSEINRMMPLYYYRIKVGLFKNYQNAAKLWEQLISLKYDANIVPIGSNFAVLVGSFLNIEQANNAANELRKKGYETLVIAL